jgi:hypothetical protein
MEITLTLSAEEEKALLDRAAASGEDVESYLHRVIDRHLKAPAILAEMLAPIRREFAESGMSEDDLDSLVEEAREEVWGEKRFQTS